MANGVGKKAGRVVVWILLSLLIVGLAGFGIGSFGGSASAVATIGNRDVTVQEYFRALSNAIRAEQAAEGRAIGR
ncbi:MAG: SurA N-terminal domain-containing protein, partial [Pseudomonadota bacterium]